MPIHDYICSNCGYEIEVLHPVHSHGPTVCPKCGGHMKQTMAAPAVHFKGSGWARKDRSDSARRIKPASKSADSGGSGSQASDSTTVPGAPAAGGASSKTDASSKDPD
jgi:putative FmdB family regulatory protein